jgi:hypothetical protein
MIAILLYVLSAITEYVGVYYHTKTPSYSISKSFINRNFVTSYFLRQFIMFGPEMVLFVHTKKTESI